jgi:GMP synthase (glutamine-hydrolysing)
MESYKDLTKRNRGQGGERFLDQLEGVSDPEKKRKIVGRVFIEVFDEEAQKVRDVKWLAQGTIYPDVLNQYRSTVLLQQ